MRLLSAVKPAHETREQRYTVTSTVKPWKGREKKEKKKAKWCIPTEILSSSFPAIARFSVSSSYLAPERELKKTRPVRVVAAAAGATAANAPPDSVCRMHCFYIGRYD